MINRYNLAHQCLFFADPLNNYRLAPKSQTGGLEVNPSDVSDVGGFFITIEGDGGDPPFVSFGRALKISAWAGEPSEYVHDTDSTRNYLIWLYSLQLCLDSSVLPTCTLPYYCQTFEFWYLITINRTENRKPEWFSATFPSSTNVTPMATSSTIPPLPIAQMFEDEQYWYPHFLAGRRVVGRVEYAAPPKDEKESHMVGPLKRWWFGFTD